MSFADIAGILGALSGVGGLSGVFLIRKTNRKLTADIEASAALTKKAAADAKKSDAESIDILTGAAADLVAPLRATLAEARAEVVDLKRQVRELTGEVMNLRSELEHERQLSNDNVLKVEVANRRAEFYQNLIENQAQGH